METEDIIGLNGLELYRLTREFNSYLKNKNKDEAKKVLDKIADGEQESTTKYLACLHFWAEFYSASPPTPETFSERRMTLLRAYVYCPASASQERREKIKELLWQEYDHLLASLTTLESKLTFLEEEKKRLSPVAQRSKKLGVKIEEALVEIGTIFYWRAAEQEHTPQRWREAAAAFEKQYLFGQEKKLSPPQQEQSLVLQLWCFYQANDRQKIKEILPRQEVQEYLFSRVPDNPSPAKETPPEQSHLTTRLVAAACYQKIGERERATLLLSAIPAAAIASNDHDTPLLKKIKRELQPRFPSRTWWESFPARLGWEKRGG